MQIKLTKEELKGLIKKYYQTLEGRCVKVNISYEGGSVGLYETFGCIISINIHEIVDFLGTKKEVTTTITEEQLREILNALLANENYELTNFKLDYGTRSVTEGSYMTERTVEKAYFNGAVIEFKKRTLDLNRGR